MTLKELMLVLPGYILVSVHDDGQFKAQGNPHHFSSGLYKRHAKDKVVLVVPIAPYHLEIYIEEA